MGSFTIYECTTMQTKTAVSGPLPSYAAAVETLNQRYRVLHLERDADNEGCADALTVDGRLLAIEPTA
jgi:hypothetical protein